MLLKCKAVLRTASNKCQIWTRTRVNIIELSTKSSRRGSQKKNVSTNKETLTVKYTRTSSCFPLCEDTHGCDASPDVSSSFWSSDIIRWHNNKQGVFLVTHFWIVKRRDINKNRRRFWHTHWTNGRPYWCSFPLVCVWVTSWWVFHIIKLKLRSLHHSDDDVLQELVTKRYNENALCDTSTDLILSWFSYLVDG